MVRRRLQAVSVLLVTIGLVVLSTWHPAASAPRRTLVVAAFGGTWEEAMNRAVVKSFQRKHNADVVVTLPGNSATILAKLRAERNNPTMDLALIGGGLETVAAREGLFQKLNFNNIPNIKNIYDAAKSPVAGYGPSVAFSGVKLAYNTRRVSPAPTSWEVLWDPKYKGKVGFPNPDNNGGLMLIFLFAKLNGGSVENADPAFRKIATLKVNNPIFWTSSPAAQDMFVQEALWVSAMFDGRVAALIQDGFPVAMVCPTEGCFVTHTYANVVTGSKNKDLAEAFINEYLSVEAQAIFAQAAGYGPVNKLTRLPRKIAELVIYGEDDIKKLISLPWDQINQFRDAWVDRWNREILSR